ncbi:hypothetical protein ACJZ2D_002964 [Fusarium nematophilum]
MSPLAQVPLRQLGKDLPKIPSIRFGLIGMSIGYGVPEGTSTRDNEDLIGRWFKLDLERRRDIFPAPKSGLRMTAEGGFLARGGKVKYLGLVHNTWARQLRPSHLGCAVEYNPWTLEIEGPSVTHLLKACEEPGVVVFAYSPLDRGIMTGPLPTRSTTLKRVTDLVIGDEFDELARSMGCTPSQLVLAWLLAQSELVFVIPGTKKIRYPEENVDAPRVRLDKEEKRELRRLVSEARIEGRRDPTFGNYTDTAPLET